MAGLSASLEARLKAAFRLASERRHAYVTLEHLLLSIIEDESASDVLRACNVDLKKLNDQLLNYIEENIEKMENDEAQKIHPQPTSTFQRVLHRAITHLQAIDPQEDVQGANVLIALFSERDSAAVHFLEEQEMTRFDATSYVSHGIRKSSEDAQKSGAEEEGEKSEVGGNGRAKVSGKKSALEKYCLNLNKMAEKGDIDPLVGREKEITRTIRILCRRTKNNPLYVGDSGVGKNGDRGRLGAADSFGRSSGASQRYRHLRVGYGRASCGNALSRRF